MKNSLIVMLLFFQAFLTYGKTCPFDSGETTNLCEQEQREVEAAMDGLSVAKQYNYCRVPSSDRPNGVGLQCRTFTLFKNKDGEITRDFFKFRFYAAEVHRTVVSDTYYVRRSDGKYDTMHDEVGDGELIIDNQKEAWRGVDVQFSQDHFPSYITKFVTPSGNPNIPDLVRLSQITYNEFMVTLTNNVDRSKEEQSVIMYGNVGPVQVP